MKIAEVRASPMVFSSTHAPGSACKRRDTYVGSRAHDSVCPLRSSFANSCSRDRSHVGRVVRRLVLEVFGDRFRFHVPVDEMRSRNLTVVNLWS